MSEMDEIIREFLVESNEGLDQMDRDLVELEKQPDSEPLLSRIFGAIHTIKGTGGVLGFNRLESVAHGGENLLSRMRDGKLKLDAATTSALLSMADALRSYLKEIESTGCEGDREFREVKELLASLLAGSAAVPQSEPEAARTPDAAATEAPAAEAPPTSQAPSEARAAETASSRQLLGEFLIDQAAVAGEAIQAALEQQGQGDPRRLAKSS